MFDKVMNAEMDAPLNCVWGISRGWSKGAPHRAVCVSVDMQGVETFVLAHYLYTLNARNVTFAQFIWDIQEDHQIGTASILYNDAGTIEVLAKTGINAMTQRGQSELNADLLIPKNLLLKEVQPFFSIIQVAAITLKNADHGICYV